MFSLSRGRSGPESKSGAAAASVFAFALAAAGCSAPAVHERVLDNGLRVLVKEDRRAPVVVSQIWYKVGSVDEPKGLSGIAHVFEHMMFKGTQRLKPNEFSRIIAEHGGRENAFTAYDYTAYFQQLEKSRLPISFELEADRMANLVLTEEEFKKEIEVVKEERRLRTEDRPEALAYERFIATAYPTHPYGHPIVGWMEDLNRITLADLRDWYRRWYVPSNAIVAIAGDVKANEVFALAEKYFGPIPAGAPDAKTIAPEARQKETRRATVRAPAEVPYILLGYHVPGYGQAERAWEPYALNVLVGVLDGGNSARFARKLVRAERIAQSVDASYSAASRYAPMLTVEGTPAKGRGIEALERAIRAELTLLKEELVTDAELARVKAQVVAQDVYGRDSVFYQAMRIGALETVGLSWRLMEDYVERIEAVSASQVREVARRYLNDDNLTVTVLEPIAGKRAPPRVRPKPGVGDHGR